MTLRLLLSLALVLAFATALAQQPQPQPQQIPGLQELGKLVPPAVRDALKGPAESAKGGEETKAAPPAPPTGRNAPRGPDGLLIVPPAAQITDLAGVLSPADRQLLKSKLDAVQTAHGAQIVVLTVPSTKPEPIEDFANRVGTTWKVGRRGVGDGVLVIAAIDDRRARIDVARALEGAIPDVTASRIIREAMAPRFQQQDYAGGLVAVVDLLAKQIEGEGLPTPAGVPQRQVDAGETLIALLFPLVLGGAIVGGMLRSIFGVKGSFVAGAGAAGLTFVLLQSIGLGMLAGLLAFGFSLVIGFAKPSRGITSRGPVIWTNGRQDNSGSWSGGSSSGGGGWSSGGGGDFSGGGASGDW